jgi:uncharacterized protein
MNARAKPHVSDKPGERPFDRALLGMIHIPALPGTPRAERTVREIAERAATEARQLIAAGFDGVIVENMHDAPYVHGTQGPEIVAAMSAAVLAVAAHVPAPGLGIQILSGGNREALAVALAAGAGFVRCENFVFAHVADEGLLERAEAGPLLRYRRSIGATHIKVFADVKKKHASHAITGDISLGEAVRASEFFGADGVIVTGEATGRPTKLDDIREARASTRLPVLVGSGVSPEQVLPLFDAGADALIVGSYIKHDGAWSNPLDQGRMAAIVRAATAARRDLERRDG